MGIIVTTSKRRQLFIGTIKGFEADNGRLPTIAEAAGLLKWPTEDALYVWRGLYEHGLFDAHPPASGLRLKEKHELFIGKVNGFKAANGRLPSIAETADALNYPRGKTYRVWRTLYAHGLLAAPPRLPGTGLTDAGKRLLSKIEEFKAANGKLPSLVEMGRELHCTRENVRQHWNRLLQSGHLRTPPRKWVPKIEEFLSASDTVYTVEEVAEQLSLDNGKIKEWLAYHPSFRDRIIWVKYASKRRAEIAARYVTVHAELAVRLGRPPTKPELAEALGRSYGSVMRFSSKNKGRLEFTDTRELSRQRSGPTMSNRALRANE
jgi:hypothetical protein